MLLVAAGATAAPPGVLGPPDGSVVTQSTAEILLEPHDGWVWEIRFARSPRTEGEALGLPPGQGQDLYDWEARLGTRPGAGFPGLFRGATRYPLSAMFTVRLSPEGNSVPVPYTLVPGRTYWYRLRWAPGSDTDPLAMFRYEWSPIRHLTIASLPPAPSTQPTPRRIRLRLLSRPRVSGQLRVGRSLRCTGARFSGAKELRYYWFRNGRPIARGFTYRVKGKDRGHRISCKVRAIGVEGDLRWAPSSPKRVPAPLRSQ